MSGGDIYENVARILFADDFEVRSRSDSEMLRAAIPSALWIRTLSFIWGSARG
jgi:hypothetical protein